MTAFLHSQWLARSSPSPRTPSSSVRRDDDERRRHPQRGRLSESVWRSRPAEFVIPHGRSPASRRRREARPTAISERQNPYSAFNFTVEMAARWWPPPGSVRPRRGEHADRYREGGDPMNTVRSSGGRIRTDAEAGLAMTPRSELEAEVRDGGTRSRPRDVIQLRTKHENVYAAAYQRVVHQDRGPVAEREGNEIAIESMELAYDRIDTSSAWPWPHRPRHFEQRPARSDAAGAHRHRGFIGFGRAWYRGSGGAIRVDVASAAPRGRTDGPRQGQLLSSPQTRRVPGIRTGRGLPVAHGSGICRSPPSRGRRRPRESSAHRTTPRWRRRSAPSRSSASPTLSCAGRRRRSSSPLCPRSH